MRPFLGYKDQLMLQNVLTSWPEDTSVLFPYHDLSDSDLEEDLRVLEPSLFCYNSLSYVK